MEQFEKIIQKNREAIANRIRKSLDIELQLSEGETEGRTVKKALSDDLSSTYNKAIAHEEFWEEMQKAHNDGDIHSNGKWVWVSSANKGRGDWRTAPSVKQGSGASTVKKEAGSTGHFDKLIDVLVKKYSAKKESVSLSEIEEKFEDYIRDQGQEPTRSAYAKPAKEAYDKIVNKWKETDDSSSSSKTVDENQHKSFTDKDMKNRPGYKTGKFIQGNSYSVAYDKNRDNSYAVMPHLGYEDKAGDSLVVGFKGEVSSLKEAKELSVKIANDLRDKKVLSTLKNMEKDFISKMKGKTATEIKKFEFNWEDVLKASKEK